MACSVAKNRLFGTEGRKEMSSKSEGSPSAIPVGKTRRDFLYVATAATGALGAAATFVPLVSQLSPDAATIAAGAPIDIDVSKVQLGQQISIAWRGSPVIVVNRTPQQLQTLQDAALLSRLADPKSSELQQPAYATNWHRSLKPEYGVLVGICTHLGCIPLFEPLPSASQPAPNWPGGYFCPCHGSKYDLAGRVFSGVPAPYNLPVPPHNFVNDTTIRVGENPPGSDFDFSSIKQI
jgi:ubiquinol-cytochrome c reductase iron-sulfur subunit